MFDNYPAYPLIYSITALKVLMYDLYTALFRLALEQSGSNLNSYAELRGCSNYV